jgi:putative hydrolase of HD superfamily
MSGIDDLLEFMIEIERLKGVLRKSRPAGLERYENSAEHSWHVCISALMLKDYANENVDIDRVIRMLLIHDLGEIDADDTIIYSSEAPELKAQEAAGVKRILSYLPENTRDEYMALWYEFESGETADAKYAKAIDRVPPLLQNISDNGHTWKKHSISKEQVFTLNARIGQGSSQLWEAVKARLEKAVAEGILE